MAFERFVSVPTGANNVEDILNDILDEIDKRGWESDNRGPETCIIIRNNIHGDDGVRNVSAIVYYGATPQEIAEDLKTI